MRAYLSRMYPLYIKAVLKVIYEHCCLPILLAPLILLSACIFSDPELSFSDSFIADHNFTVALNTTSDGLDISFTPQDNASYALTRSSAKTCSNISSDTTCADYIEFEIFVEDSNYIDSLPERTYYYKLAISMAGVNETLAAQYPPLDPPSLIAADAGDKQLTLSWLNVAGASSYNLYGAHVSGVTPENYATLEGGFRERGVTNPYTLDEPFEWFYLLSWCSLQSTPMVLKVLTLRRLMQLQ